FSADSGNGRLRMARAYPPADSVVSRLRLRHGQEPSGRAAGADPRRRKTKTPRERRGPARPARSASFRLLRGAPCASAPRAGRLDGVLADPVRLDSARVSQARHCVGLVRRGERGGSHMNEKAPELSGTPERPSGRRVRLFAVAAVLAT